MFRRLWQSISLDLRVALGCTMAFIAILGIDVYTTISSGVASARQAQHRLLDVEVSALTQLLAESAAAADYGTIEALLERRLRQPAIEHIEWTDGTGILIADTAAPVTTDAPVWFQRLLDLRTLEKRDTIVVGGVHRGEVRVRAGANHAVGALWRVASSEATSAMVSLAGVLACALLIAHQALRPLRHLNAVLSRFGAGHFAARAVVGGPYEIASTIRAFNRMAGEIDSGVAALRTSERKNRQLATIVEQSGEAILTRDMDGHITSWNAGAERLFGYTASEAIGKSARELHMRNLSDAEFQAMRQRLQSRESVVTEGERLTKSGELIHVEASVTPLFDDSGEMIGAVGIARDVTARRRMEQLLRSAHDELEQRVLQRTEQLSAATEAAQQASRAKSEFVANMSHEIRTPLNGVLGMLRLLQKSELTPRQQHFARTALTSGVGLMKVLNDVLDFSKIEAGKLELEVTDFSLRERVGDVVQLFAQRAQDKGLEIACRVRPDVPDAVRGDPGRVRQVLSNLIGNAVKFTKAGEVVITVDVERRDDEHVLLHFGVRDTGCGIDATRHAEIFEAFTQADASTTRQYGGTGLGLTVSRSLVKLMGGEIGVDSAPGRGASFWFTANLAYGETSDTAAETADLRGMRVIALEPNAANREILEHQLRDCGVQAHVVCTGAELIAHMAPAVAEARYPVALLAVNDDAGLHWVNAIREQPAFDPVRVLLLSSLSFDVPAARLRRLRIDRVLNKPVLERNLHHALGELVTGAASPASTQDRARPRSNARILIVDDYAVNQEIARELCESLGCRVDTANDGRAAVNAVAQHHYDLVLMDCQMPEMDGYQATAAIRQQQAAGSPRLPIVALTAHAMRGDRDLCLAAGMDDYVSKPFDPDQLQAVLERWLTLPAAQERASPAAAVAHCSPTLSGDMIDSAAIAKLRAMQRPGKPPLLHQWISAFLATAAAQLRSMQEAVEGDDAPTLHRWAHTLKSGAAQFGATQFSRSCAALEALARDGDLSNAQELVSRLQAEYEPVRAALQRHLHHDDPGANTSATADAGGAAGTNQ